MTCSAHAFQTDEEVATFPPELRWHCARCHRNVGGHLAARDAAYPGVVDNTPPCALCGCQQGKHLHKEPHACVHHLECEGYIELPQIGWWRRKAWWKIVNFWNWLHGRRVLS